MDFCKTCQIIKAVLTSYMFLNPVAYIVKAFSIAYIQDSKYFKVIKLYYTEVQNL